MAIKLIAWIFAIITLFSENKAVRICGRNVTCGWCTKISASEYEEALKEYFTTAWTEDQGPRKQELSEKIKKYALPLFKKLDAEIQRSKGTKEEKYFEIYDQIVPNDVYFKIHYHYMKAHCTSRFESASFTIDHIRDILGIPNPQENV